MTSGSMTSLLYTDASERRHPHVFAAVVDHALASGRVARFRAEGASMHPTSRDGESIAIASVAADDIVAGDVLLCRHETRLLAHRVVRVSARGEARVFELRGDAKQACDAPIGAEAVVGQVIAVHRGGRAVSLTGRAARLRRAAHVAASRAKACVTWWASVYHPNR
jgi:signal peptidase I